VLIPPRWLLNIFVGLVMISIGLRVRRADFFNILRNRGLLGRSLLANCVLVPAFGFLLTRLVPLDASGKIGILLLAAVPGTPVALQFTRTARNRLAFVATLAFILSMSAVVIAPVAVQLVPHQQSQYRPTEDLILSLLVQIVFPLGLGALLARLWPAAAPALGKWLDILATVVFLFLMWETRGIRREAFRSLEGRLIGAMVALLIAGMTIGWWLGGPDRESRRVMATSTSMRNVVVTFFVARYWFPDTQVYFVPIAYLGMMVPANLIFTLVEKLLQRKSTAERALAK